MFLKSWFTHDELLPEGRQLLKGVALGGEEEVVEDEDEDPPEADGAPAPEDED